MKLVGRRAECGVLDRLIEDVCAGESRALVVSGEAGVGKTALLDYLARRASEYRVERAAGVQSEMGCRLPRCISCARLCSRSSRAYRHRSEMPWKLRSA